MKCNLFRNLNLCFILIFCASCTSPGYASIYTYKAKLFAVAYIDTLTRGYYWSDWQQSDVDVVIDLNNFTITVDSKDEQLYKIIDYNNTWEDDEGCGQTLKMITIDKDGDTGSCRLRIDPKGSSQIYFDYNNVAWCYSGLKLEQKDL